MAKQLELLRELRDKTDDELRAEIARQRASLYDFRTRIALRQMDNTSAVSAARKQIARAMTILRERELAAQRGGERVDG